MQLEPVCLGKNYRKAKRLYIQAFPKIERLPLFLLYLRSWGKKVEYFSFKENQELIGLAYIITHKDLTYILYLAVDESQRGKGFGSEQLAEIRKLHPNNRFILEIEPVDLAAKNNEQRKKRLAFYNKNGFQLTGHRIIDCKVFYDVLTYEKKEVSQREYETLLKNFLTFIFRPFFKHFFKCRW